MENKYCPHCGAPSNSAKCEHCGTLIPGAMAPPFRSVNILSYYPKSWVNCVNFKGRARRAEYVVPSVINTAIFFVLASLGTDWLHIAFVLAMLVPMLALTARRLHDLGYSAWLVICYLIPMINFAVGLYCFFKKGVAGSNKYGDDPLAKENLI